MQLILNNPLEQFLLLQAVEAALVWPLFLDLLRELNDTLLSFSSSSLLVLNLFVLTQVSINFAIPVYLSLVNLQYYKLSFFLIALLTIFSIYKSKIFPKTLWQYFSQQSHIIAQSVLKPTFGAHYPFEVRFYNYYPFLYHIFLFILCNNLLGLVPYGFSNSAYIVHNFTLSFLLLSGLTIIVYLYKEFIIINYLFLKIYQPI